MSGIAVFVIIGLALLMVIGASVFVFSLTQREKDDRLEIRKESNITKHRSTDSTTSDQQ